MPRLSYASLLSLSRPLWLLIPTATLACWVEPAPSRRTEPAPVAPTPRPPAQTSPVRVSLESGRTLDAAPGQGAGVFVTYSEGGLWSIAWTCDTALTAGGTCAYEIAVGTSGYDDLAVTPAGAVVARDATTFSLRTTTTATLDRATFRTTPGASIALSMRLRGAPYPNLIFFVNDGRLATAPADPVEFVPTNP
jgi:hypothetical protein